MLTGLFSSYYVWFFKTWYKGNILEKFSLAIHLSLITTIVGNGANELILLLKLQNLTIKGTIASAVAGLATGSFVGIKY